MRITKRQLRRIIKEEKRKVLCEGAPSLPTLELRLSDSSDEVVLTHAEADTEIQVNHYLNGQELIEDVQAYLGPYPAHEIVLDFDNLLENMPLADVYDAVYEQEQAWRTGALQ